MTPGDVVVAPRGTLVLFDLVSRAAESWVDEHVEPDAQWFCGPLVVEHRFAEELARGMAQDGLAVCLESSLRREPIR